jgi:type VI secretion system protein ImpK
VSTIALASPAAAGTAAPPSLRQLVQDGAYLILLLRNGEAPGDAEAFKRRVDRYFEDFEAQARAHGYGAEPIADAKYALAAFLDESILNSRAALRDEWELYPLQLRYFGEHLAGEGFFTKLERLRLEPDKHVAVLEVYHLCILLGFQGKYKFEGSEKLRYLAAALGQEIQRIRGDKASFAPSATPASELAQVVAYELPLWVFVTLAFALGLACYLGYGYLLGDRVDALLANVRRLAGG